MSNSTSILQETQIYESLVKRNSIYIEHVNKAAKVVQRQLDSVVKIFESYTSHNIDHSKKVMDYMYRLVNNPKSLTDEEIVLMIFAALFHDIGMALSDEEIDKIKNGTASNGDFVYDFNKVLKAYNNNEKAAIAGVVRSFHGKRSAQMIKSFVDNGLPQEIVNGNSEKIDRSEMCKIFSFYLPGSDVQIPFADYLALICESHEQSISWIETTIKELKLFNDVTINGQYIACLLRLADLLDFDCDRAPRFYEWIRTIEESSKEYFYINQMVFPGEKIYRCNKEACIPDCANSKCCGKSQLVIKIRGNYPNDKDMTQSQKDEIYGKCLEYFEYTEHELQAVLDLSRSWKEPINLCNKIIIELNKPDDLAIDPPKKLEVEYPVVRDLFLGENLYKDKKIGLRELIQNAYDACIEYREIYEQLSARDKLTSPYTPLIQVIIDHSKNKFIIQDNGVGMSFSTITNCFLHVGKSIYEGDKYRYTNFHNNHIGHFGIGFFAAYMLSEHVEIVTKYYDSNEEITARLTKQLEYVTIVKNDIQAHSQQGTFIILSLDEVMSVFESVDNVESYILENFIEAGISIRIASINEDGTTKLNPLLLPSVKNINLSTNLKVNKVDLSKYFNNVEMVAHFSDEKVYQTEMHSIQDDHNFLYDGTRFVEVDLPTLEEYIISCKRQICFYKILQAKCNLFVPEQYWINNQAPFGFEGYTRNVNISYPNLPIYDNYCFSNFMTDTKIDIQIPGRASVQELNVLVDALQPAPLYFERNKEFKRNALALYLNQACGEADKIDTVFIRNVRIPNFHIKVPFLLYRINVVNINCNIFTDNVFPTTDRLDVQASVKKEFSYAVGKALTLNYLERTNDTKEKRVLEMYLKKYYPSTNIFLRDSNS